VIAPITYQKDAQQGLTVTDDADGDNVIVRTNGQTVTVEASEAGQVFTLNTCAP